MLYDQIPLRIDQWYQDEGNDLSFTVIEFDSEEGIIEVRYLDGEIDEMSIEDWEELSLAEIEQPNDWPWPIDELEQNDPKYDESEGGER